MPACPVLIVLAFLQARPGPCPPPALQRDEGSLARAGARCDSYVVTTNATGEPWSWGSATYGEALPERFALSLSWRRLSADGDHSMEVWFPGGVLLVKNEHWGFYESEYQFERDGWRPLPGFSSHAASRWRLEHRGAVVAAFLDGEKLGEFRPADIPPDRELGVGLKGRSGHRSSLLVEDLQLDELQ